MKHRFLKLMVTLAVTPPSVGPNWNSHLNCFEHPTTLQRLQFLAHIKFGNLYAQYQETQGKTSVQNPCATPQSKPQGPRFTRKTPDPCQKTPTNPQGASPSASATVSTLTGSAFQAAPTPKPPRGKPKFFTFFDVHTPGHDPIPPGREGWPIRDNIATAMTPALLTALYKVDPNAKLYRNPSEDTTTKDFAWIHLHSPRKCFPTTKRRYDRYVARQWFRPDGSASTAFVYIGHDAPVEDLLAAFTVDVDYEDCGGFNETAPQFGLQLSTLQSADVVPVGWLLGTDRYTNTANLAKAISATSEFSSSDITVECRYTYIRENPNEWIPFDERVHAVHVYAAKKHYHQAQRKLYKCYRGSRKNGFPEGKKLYVVASYATKMCTLGLRGKDFATHEAFKEQQAIYLATITNIPLRNVIKSATTPVSAHWDVTLHDFLTGLQEKHRPNRSFIALNQDREDPGLWYLTALTSDKNHANELAQIIGLMCAHYFGDAVWLEWFTAEYMQSQKAQFYYDAALQKYLPRSSLNMASLRQTPIIQDNFQGMNDIPDEPCLIENLRVLLDGSFAKQSVINLPPGASVATTIQGKPPILDTVFTTDPVEETDWENLDDDDEPMTTAMNSHQATDVNSHQATDVSSSAPALTATHVDMTGAASVAGDIRASAASPVAVDMTGEDSSSSLDPGNDTRLPDTQQELDLTRDDSSIAMTETSLAVADEDMKPPAKAYDEPVFPMDNSIYIFKIIFEKAVTPADFQGFSGGYDRVHSLFKEWRARPTSGNPARVESRQIILRTILHFDISVTDYFDKRWDWHYSDIYYEATIAWTTTIRQDAHASFIIPYSRGPDYNPDLQQLCPEAWFWHKPPVDSDVLVEFFHFEARECRQTVEATLQHYAAMDPRDFGDRYAELVDHQWSSLGRPVSCYHSNTALPDDRVEGGIG